jgi:hypothetical protein
MSICLSCLQPIKLRHDLQIGTQRYRYSTEQVQTGTEQVHNKVQNTYNVQTRTRSGTKLVEVEGTCSGL